uniref:Gnk2-homologous domain-containing protein n=1 Tax=Quercus lobata TaxID=97700 RepID=A0A7N2LIH8_QUELO
MLCSKYISFSFLLFSLFLHAVNCADPLYHFCFSQENYTANSPYGKELGDRCPHKKGAIIWYDNCLLKYSNIHFFGEIDNKNKFYLWNVQDVENPTSFNPKVKDLLIRLSNKAYANPKFYATGDLKLDSSSKLYGWAQCTRDLSGLDCKKCLETAISELPNC